MIPRSFQLWEIPLFPKTQTPTFSVKSVVLILEVKGHFYRSHLRPSEMLDLYIVIHNSSKITVMKCNKNNFMVVGTTTWRTVLRITALGRLKISELNAYITIRINTRSFLWDRLATLDLRCGKLIEVKPGSKAVFSSIIWLKGKAKTEHYFIRAITMAMQFENNKVKYFGNF